MSRLPRQLLSAALVVALVHVAFVASRWVAQGSEAPPDDARRDPGDALMPAAGGPLEQIAIQFHRRGQARFLVVYEQLFAALDPSTEVVVVVADDEDRARFETARIAWRRRHGAGPAVTYAIVGRPITSWARDRFAVLSSSDGAPTILAPPTPMTGPEARANDWLVPWTVAAHLGDRERIRTATFRFDGGDLIADQTHVYVATPLYERNPEVAAARLTDSVHEALSRPVVRLGREGRPSPSHHIGMFVTPLGGGRVAYGDPALGLELIGGAAALDVGGAPLEIDASPDTLRSFVDVGDTLRAHGLETLALPLLASTTPHIWLSYNNVLMERRSDGRLHVYMPAYGLPTLDARAQAIYESVGAVVHPIRVEGLFRLGGTVRCLVAPLRRG